MIRSVLHLAEKTCTWIEKSDVEYDSYIMVLNRMQIAKRLRKLNTAEMLKLAQIIESDATVDIRCGVYLLLDDNESAQKCFREMPTVQQKEFLKFPICHFGNLGVENDAQQIGSAGL